MVREGCPRSLFEYKVIRDGSGAEVFCLSLGEKGRSIIIRITFLGMVL